MAARLRQPANRVARAAIWLWALRGLVQVIMLAAALAVVAWVIAQQPEPGGPPLWLHDHAFWLAAAVAVAAAIPLTLLEPLFRYLVHRWEVTGDVIYTQRGWLDRRWHLIPISRIQTVDTDRGPIERVLDLATVRIHTASHAGSSSIEGLSVAVASELAEALAREANRLRDDAT